MVKPLAINKPIAETRVVVAMSGGVDSSTVAALLHEQGYQVIGVTLQLYDYGQMPMKKGACCAGQDIYDAKMVAEKLGIPHYVLDYENKFNAGVMQDFADSYLRGETPIPCVRCNQTVKFRDLLTVAKDLGADALVTGHYVQRVEGAEKAELHAAIDPKKDQSYFLFATTQAQLDFMHFPLGGMTKAETRAHAERFGLPVAEKPDSQDICFVPSGGYVSVVERLRPEGFIDGDIVHTDGRVLGRHKGIAHFTIGQRKGLGLGHHEVMFVVKIDAENHRVIVGPREALTKDMFVVKELNWLGDALPETGGRVQVKVRSMQPKLSATVYRTENGARVVLDAPHEAITPGQACVFYDGARVLGGGWITREISRSSEAEKFAA